MGDLFYLGDAGSTMYLDTGICRGWRLPFISIVPHVRTPLSCALFRFVARKLRFRHDYRTAITFIHANTAHIYPYFLVMHFVFRNKGERFQGVRTDVIDFALIKNQLFFSVGCPWHGQLRNR